MYSKLANFYIESIQKLIRYNYIIVGCSYYFDIHSHYYFGVIWALNGLFQSAGWPCCVAIMVNCLIVDVNHYLISSIGIPFSTSPIECRATGLIRAEVVSMVSGVPIYLYVCQSDQYLSIQLKCRLYSYPYSFMLSSSCYKLLGWEYLRCSSGFSLFAFVARLANSFLDKR